MICKMWLAGLSVCTTNVTTFLLKRYRGLRYSTSAPLLLELDRVVVAVVAVVAVAAASFFRSPLPL